MVSASGSRTSSAASISDWRRRAPDALVADAFARPGHQALAAAFVRAPQFLGGNGMHAIPDVAVGRLLAPVRTEIAIVELVHLERNPTAEVDAVGDVADRNFVHRTRSGHSDCHICRLTSPCSLLTPFERDASRKRQHGHAELAGSCGPCARAPGNRAWDMPRRARRIAEIAVHQFRREIVVAGFDRSVRGEHQAGGGELARFGEDSGRLRLHQVPHMFEREKGRVAFVHVIDGGLQTQGLQRAIAADAEQDLLADAHLAVAAVELVGDVAILRAGIGANVGVEQVERDAADLHPPDLRIDRVPARSHLDHQRLAVASRDRAQRQIVKVVVLVCFLLPARLVQVLAEVSLLIEQPDADQRNAQIAGRLQMIAGENAQAAGEDRETFGESRTRRRSKR